MVSNESVAELGLEARQSAHACYGLNICLSSNPSVAALTSNVMVLTCGLEKITRVSCGQEDGALMVGLVPC